MRIALTGTPGTGKTTAARLLMNNYPVYSVKALALDKGCAERYPDEEELIVDTECLSMKLRMMEEGDHIIDGHLSHLLEPDIIIILRCHPEVLMKRLLPRGYSEEKLMENLEAEAIDVILEESLETGKPVYEVDTTERDPDHVVESILDILFGNEDGYEPGKIDWSEVILEWY